MGRKIIFLDIDGVLNCQDFYQEALEEDGIDIFNEDILSPVAICRLNHIINETGAEIVLSSSWKYDERSLNIVKSYLNNPNLSTTPDSRCKEEEIATWLRENPDVDNYVVLDDDDLQLRGNLVKTTFAHGLTRKEVDEVIKILGRKKND